VALQRTHGRDFVPLYLESGLAAEEDLRAS